MSATPPSHRELRVVLPGPQVAKARLPIFDSSSLAGIEWIRLAQKKFTSQFYPSRKSRFTPDSWEFPCCYLGQDMLTSTAEVIGDRLALNIRKKISITVFPKKEAQEMHYLSLLKFPELKLCNLTDRDTRLALNFEAGAMMTPDLSIPQAWAQAVAEHKNGYDGIFYRSRHTDLACVVLWNRKGRRALKKDVIFAPMGEFYCADAAYELARKMGTKIAFAS